MQKARSILSSNTAHHCVRAYEYRGDTENSIAASMETFWLQAVQLRASQKMMLLSAFEATANLLTSTAWSKQVKAAPTARASKGFGGGTGKRKR